MCVCMCVCVYVVGAVTCSMSRRRMYTTASGVAVKPKKL